MVHSWEGQPESMKVYRKMMLRQKIETEEMMQVKLGYFPPVDFEAMYLADLANMHRMRLASGFSMV